MRASHVARARVRVLRLVSTRQPSDALMRAARDHVCTQETARMLVQRACLGATR